MSDEFENEPEVDIPEVQFRELESNRGKALKAVLSFVAVIVVFILTGVAISILNATKPEAEKKESVAVALPQVAVAEVLRREGRTLITAEGVVESGRVVTLSAEVGGKIVELSPRLTAGGQVRAGELLARIEMADYRAALEQAKSAVADAALAVEQEQAKRAQALRDWEQLGQGEPSDLLVRKPQLASAKARLESAKAEVERAQRNVERTVIRAPFDAVVREEAVEIGANLVPGAQLVTLFSPTELEVELPLKLEDYAVLRREESGQPVGEVTLRAQLGAQNMEWQGEIVRTSGEVARGALTAGVVVEIAPGKEGEALPPPGLFVNAVLEGDEVAGLVVPRESVRDGNRVVIVKEDQTIEFRELTIVRTTPESVLVSGGVEQGERVVLTRLNNAVGGMEVEVQEGGEE